MLFEITVRKLFYFHMRKNSIRDAIFLTLFASVYIYSFSKPFVIPPISSSILNILDGVFITDNKPTLIYTCLGEHAFSIHQAYIWKSLEQSRLVAGPSLSIVVIVSKLGLTTKIRKRFEKLDVTFFIYENLISSKNYNATLIYDFRQVFFVQGAMEPNNNLDFNRLTTERLFAVHAYMKVTSTSNVFHMENDNMLYDDLVYLLRRMQVCRAFFALPRASKDEAVISFLYIRNSRAVEHLLRFITQVFRLGRKRAVNYLNTTWINEMSITARYLDLFANESKNSKSGGILQLPTQLTGRNCCLCEPDSKGESVIFDARTLGQYFGGDFWRPNRPFYWRQTELVDPRGLLIKWKRVKGVRIPYIRGFRIINFHVHSKRLQQFSSDTNNQVMGKGFNRKLTHS